MFGPNCHPASANCPTFSTWQSARKFYHVTDVYDVTAYQMVQLRVGISSLSFSLSFSRWPNFLCQNIQDKIFHRFHSTHASDPFSGLRNERLFALSEPSELPFSQLWNYHRSRHEKICKLSYAIIFSSGTCVGGKSIVFPIQHSHDQRGGV